MKLWTIQSIDVWKKLKKEKIITCDPKLASYLKDEECSFLEPYNWMRKEMINRIGNSTNKSNIYPIWGWYINNGLNKKPDLRRSAHGPSGEQMVCMELEIREDKVVLSDFNLWHCVLNNGYIGDATTEEALDEEYEWLYTLSEDEKQRVIEKSWDKIFNIGKSFNNEYFSSRDYIQATFWELNLNDVKDIQIFKAR